MSFHNVNATVARQSSKAGVTGQQHQQPQKQQQQGKGALISADSLSSSESSSSSSDISEDSMAHGRKGPRPAYSMSNMHNSLGYLP